MQRIFLSVFFLLIVFVGVAVLAANNRIFYAVPMRDILLMALTIFRLIRLFTYDVITKFVRDWFTDAEPDSFRHTIGVLLNCPWCIGLWFSFFVVFFYFSTVYSWPIILGLALAALGSFFQIVANWVGWSAELKKREALSQM